MAEKKSRWAASVFAIIAAMSLFFLNWPFRYLEHAAGWTNVGAVEFQWNPVRSGMPHIRGGFPWSYLTTHSPEMGSTLLESILGREANWNPGAAVANFMLALFIVSLTFGITLLRYQWKANNDGSLRLVNILDYSLVTVVLLTIGSIGFYLHSKTTQQIQLARYLTRHGNCYLVSELPSWLDGKLPDQVTRLLMRIRYVIVYDPTPELVQRILDETSLYGLGVIRGRIELHQLKILATNSTFDSLHLRDVPLTDAHFELIGSIGSLHELDLSRQTITHSQLRMLDSLDRLQDVSFSGCIIRLADIGRPRWRHSVKRLMLPRNPEGGPDKLSLIGWTQLQTLAVSHQDLTLSSHLIELELERLPKLYSVNIDRVQKYSLRARDLPAFQYFSEGIDRVLMFSRVDADVPMQTWFTRIDIDNLPHLISLGCYLQNLESISIKNCPSLDSLSLANGSLNMLPMANRPTSVGNEQRVLNDLGHCEGPPNIEIWRTNLTDSSLVPLVQNQRIRSLRFRESTIAPEQLRDLAGLVDLQQLDAEWCEMNDENLNWLLNTFPNLETLELDLRRIERLELNQLPKLGAFRTRRFEKANRVELVSVPKLEMQLHLSGNVDALHVHQAPRLLGIGMEEPWPEQASMSGLRHLRWFAAGGSQVNDQVVRSLLACPTLDRLMLAYPSLSRAALREIGAFHELTSLVLPGSGVDDTIAHAYRQMKVLREVNFDDCDVGPVTFEWLQRIESLRRLSLNRVPLDSSEFNWLYRLLQLNELEISGMTVTDDQLRQLLKKIPLEHLNCSGIALSQDQIDSLKNHSKLRLLNATECGCNAEEVVELLNANQQMSLFLGDAARQHLVETGNLSPELQSRLITEERYYFLRRSLANYSVIDSGYRARIPSTDRSEADSEADESNFGWFNPNRFRKSSSKTVAVETNANRNEDNFCGLTWGAAKVNLSN